MKFISKEDAKMIAALVGAAILSGCANQNVQSASSSTPEFASCSANVWVSAEQTDTTAKYYSVAQQAQNCLSYAPVFHSEHALSSAEATDVLRLHALTVTNLLVAGELSQARKAFNDFELAFPHSDLQLADGSSFVDSMTLLFDPGSSVQASNGSLLNASAPLKAELRRQHYWIVN